MKNHSEHRAREAKIPKHQIVLSKRVGSGHLFSEAGYAIVVGEEVEEREEDGEGFLHAQEAIERPFAVELEDRFAVRGIAGLADVGYDVLAGVVALGGAVPEEETALEGFESSVWYDSIDEKLLRIDGPPGTQLDSLHCCTRLEALLLLRIVV
jgi:hypothetical protein